MRTRVSLTLASVFLALTTPAAMAEWTAPQVLVKPAGEQLRAGASVLNVEAFTWRVTTKRVLRTRGRSGFASYVQARIRLSDGRLRAIQTISPRSGRFVSNPVIALDSSFVATAVWAEAGGSHTTIMAAVRPRGRRFGKPFEIGRSGAFVDARPALDVAQDGAAVVAWNSGRSVKVARRREGPCSARSARGCFGRVQDLPAGADQAVAMGVDGSAYVVWAAGVRRGGDNGTVLRVAVARPRARRFGASQAVSRSGDASQPAFDVTDGRATIVWRASVPAGGEQDAGAPIFAAVRTPDGAISAPQQISQFPGKRPQVRVIRDGEAIIAFDQIHPTQQNPDGQEVAYALRPAGTGARFGPAATISPPGSPAGSVTLASREILAYSASPGGVTGPFAFSHYRRPGSQFGDPEAMPADFTGTTVFTAGASITAVSAGSGGATLVSDFLRPSRPGP